MASSLTSNSQTMMHLLKGNIGTGILAMPSAFANAGLAVGTLGIPFMGLIAIHSMHMLVNCQRKLCQKFGCTFLDYEEVAEKAMEAGPEALQKHSKYGRKAVSVFLMITQLGFCCVYGLFVAESIARVTCGLTHGGVKINVVFYLMMILPFMILLNCIRSLKHLAYVSTCANILQMTGLILVFYDLMHDLPDVSTRPASLGFAKLPLYFGTAIYAFEGIGIVLPLQKDMKEPQAFGGKVGVLNTAMVIVACLYTGTGFFGYLKYGSDAKGSITLNLDQTSLNEVVRLMFALAIFLSYALQMYVPFNLVWPWVQNMFELSNSDPKTKRFEVLARGSMVTATFMLAGAIPKLDLFISLVGALSSSCLALIFPPAIDIATHWDELPDYSRRKRILFLTKNMAISIFGILGFITGTYASLDQIVKSFSSTPKEVNPDQELDVCLNL